MENLNEHLEANCFVFIQGNEVDIEKYYDLVRLSKNDDIILYPERAMTFADHACYRPYVKTVVTENPFIISSYPRKNVWIIRNGEWVNPSMQTYGCSVNVIMDDLLGTNTSIPLAVLGGIEEIEKYREKIRLNNFQYD